MSRVNFPTATGTSIADGGNLLGIRASKIGVGDLCAVLGLEVTFPYQQPPLGFTSSISPPRDVATFFLASSVSLDRKKQAELVVTTIARLP